jgi:histidinol phosphatase-like enzyme (inositol monophosphatase family)
MASWNKELDLAVSAARQAAELALKYQQGIEIETKPDDSPVTRADRECERLIASILTSAFPDDGVFGEEGARAESKSGRRWIIDPIDGTRDYVRGNQLWANLVALEDGGNIVAGVVNLPALGLTYIASKGGGAYRNGTPIHPSLKTRIADSVLCFSGFSKLDRLPFRAGLLDWMAQFWAVRALGGAPDAMMVAAGQAEIFIEADAKPWDFAPLKIIVEESGGIYLNMDGGSTIYAGNCVTCAPGLEGEVRALLRLNGQNE